MSRRRNRSRAAGAPAVEPEGLEVSEPTIHALAIVPDGIGYREVRLRLPIEVVEEYALESRDPDHIGVLCMRAFEWAGELPDRLAQEARE